MLPNAKLDQVLRRYDEVQALLASVDIAPDRLADLSREFSGLEPVVDGVAGEAAASTIDDLGGFAFMAEIAAMNHETLQPRLFLS